MSLRSYSCFVSAFTFVLVIAGALVTSTGSGLAVPDWPLSFGQFFPRMEGGVLFEHGHRMIAGTVGILTAVMTIWIWKTERRRWVSGLAAVALAAVVLQALLGGATVLLKLPPRVSIAHAILAQSFFSLTVALAFFLNRVDIQGFSFESDSVNFLSAGSTLLLFVQLGLGAALRHAGSPQFLWLHALLAVVIIAANALLFAAFKRNQNGFLIRFSRAMMSLFAVQVALGLFSGFPMIISMDMSWAARVSIVTAHVALGAALLAASLLGTLEVLTQRNQDLELIKA